MQAAKQESIELETTLQNKLNTLIEPLGAQAGSIEAISAAISDLEKQINETDASDQSAIRLLVEDLRELQKELIAAENLVGRVQQGLRPGAQSSLSVGGGSDTFSSQVLSAFGIQSQTADTELNDEVQALGDRLLKRVESLKQKLAQEGEKKPFIQELLGLSDGEFQGLKDLETNLLALTKTITDAQIESLDRRISAQEEVVGKAKEIASEGNAELLQAEEDKLNRLLELRERAARRQQQIDALVIAANQAVAVSAAITSIATNAAGGPIAIAATIAGIIAGIAAATVALNSAFGSLPTFWEGADRLGDAVPGHAPGRDSIMIRADKDEMIVKSSIATKLRSMGVGQKDLVALAAMNSVQQTEMVAYTDRAAVSAQPNQSKEIVNELKGVRRELNDLTIRQEIKGNALQTMVANEHRYQAYINSLIG